jgi:hypothetical protein
MKSRDFTTTLLVDQTPEQAFEAITNVRGWWSGDIEGGTAKLGDEFTYRYKTIHYSKQRITELVPNEKVVWLVLDSRLEFVDDKTEWNGTKVTFDVSRRGDKTEIRFTHVGLVAAQECYDACSSAWSSIVGSSLKRLITTGTGEPLAKAKRPLERPAL